ncbi:MAG: UDP-2,3-diacylglucosamine diphosphatase [Gammaproteobacteria bacterium]|nr:UDP-2,3-diacylglucosamine diphosphatase [Gammaproteobacteria bacterium]
MQGETLFISDLHLDSKQPEIQKQFLQFIEQDAMGSDALYILGDLFEVWLGDDDDNPDNLLVIQKLKQLTDQGTPVYIQHGNRDFLLGKHFEDISGSILLPDPHVIDLYNQRILIMHGDLLCTDDIEYQKFRKTVRNPDWQKQTLQLSLDKRKELAKSIRIKSQQQTQQKFEDIMDVNQQEVEKMLLQHNSLLLIHGHTHRPAIHKVDIEKQQATRIVLGDWYDQGSVLRWNAEGYKLDSLTR